MMSLKKQNMLHITSKTRCIKHSTSQLKSSTTSSSVLIALFCSEAVFLGHVGVGVGGLGVSVGVGVNLVGYGSGVGVVDSSRATSGC